MKLFCTNSSCGTLRHPAKHNTGNSTEDSTPRGDTSTPADHDTSKATDGSCSIMLGNADDSPTLCAVSPSALPSSTATLLPPLLLFYDLQGFLLTIVTAHDANHLSIAVHEEPAVVCWLLRVRCQLLPAWHMAAQQHSCSVLLLRGPPGIIMDHLQRWWLPIQVIKPICLLSWAHVLQYRSYAWTAARAAAVVAHRAG